MAIKTTLIKKIFAIFLSVMLISSSSAASSLSNSASNLAEDISTLPQSVLGHMKDIYLRPENFTALSLAGGASIIMHNNGSDDKIARNFEDNKALREFTDRGLDFIGGPGQHFALTGLWYLAADISGDELNKERAWIMMESLSVTGFTTLSLKLARHNKTPNDKPLAWPSGHTSSSFTVAAVLDEFYGPWVGLPSYCLAGAVAYRMMETGDHWGSDVVFGAVLGYITGKGVASGKGTPEIAGFKITPFLGSEHTNNSQAMGFSLVKRF